MSRARLPAPVARRILAPVGMAAVVFSLGACGSSSNPQSCAGGPKPPGMRATLTADQPFTASDVNNLSRRFYTAGATCVAVGTPGGTTVELSEQGITGAPAQQLLKPGRLVFVTWVKQTAPAGSAPLHIIDAVQVPTTDGGTCAASAAVLECVPTGYAGVESGIDGNAVTAVSEHVDPSTNQRVVELTLNGTATTSMAQLTFQMPSATPPLNELAIFIDGTMINNAAVQSPLNNGQIQVSGGRIATEKGYATTLVNLINTGRVTPYRVTSQSNL